MSSSPYARDMHTILAALQEQGEAEQQLPEEEPINTIYVYRTDTGGILLEHTKIAGDEGEQLHTPIVESEPPTPQTQAPRKAPPLYAVVLLIFCIFLFLDSADVSLAAFFTPTATITIIPKVKTITLQSSIKLGKLLSPITLSESQTVATTGTGHQDARAATGTLTFYNGSLHPQTIEAGALYTGSDGVEVVTDQPVTIPAAQPPQEGAATGTASALYAGSQGNIRAGDITLALSSDLFVKNLVPFSGGKDARDFSTVSPQDINTAAATLTGKVSASMNAALQQQLLPTEQAKKMPCHPIVTSDHQPGDESPTVTVTVSQTCTVIAYNREELLKRAAQLLTTQAQTFGAGYSLFGSVQVAITRVAIGKPDAVVLTFVSSGTWVYALSRSTQAQIIRGIAGKPRQQALHLLSAMPGVQRVSIAGIPDNTLLPQDPQHITFVELIGL